jgi:branched-chain amino acid transport system substrate-binding protein
MLAGKTGQGGGTMRARTIFLTAVALLAAETARADILIATAAPMTGRLAWYGEQWQRGTQLAVDDLNAAGGLLGQRVELTFGDDNCDPAQAVALARSLAARRVAAVIGHTCSEAAIAAAPVYEAARVVMIAPTASNPTLTDSGWRHVFRTFGRDDLQGRIAAEYLVREHAADRIAIVFTQGTYSRGLAAETKRRLNELGVKEVAFIEVNAASADWAAVVEQLGKEGIEVIYAPMHGPDAGLLIRSAADLGRTFVVVGGDAISPEDFWLITREAGEGTRFTYGPDPRTFPQAKDVIERFRRTGYEPASNTLYIYAAVQVWAQAVAQAGTLELEAVMRVLHEAEFDTVLGRIGFDEKGDVEGFEPFVWYIWRGGKYVPLEEPRTE